mmetsp:Transcript_28043/g.65224  ORF Transcript_28043/g.65224 Transcript_28043/m.65224 type:complete len:86 (+) Transcript_28043:238-495(+)
MKRTPAQVVPDPAVDAQEALRRTQPLQKPLPQPVQEPPPELVPGPVQVQQVLPPEAPAPELLPVQTSLLRLKPDVSWLARNFPRK